MENKFLLPFIKIHILYHASKSKIYGHWMKQELERHGYSISYGTLYPTLHKLLSEEYLTCEKEIIQGKVRKYYSITEKGKILLDILRDKVKELVDEIME